MFKIPRVQVQAKIRRAQDLDDETAVAFWRQWATTYDNVKKTLGRKYADALLPQYPNTGRNVVKARIKKSKAVGDVDAVDALMTRLKELPR